MRLIYIDDSGDDSATAYSALCIHEAKWRECFRMIRELRRDFKRRYGLFVRKELHATELVAGRGHLSDTVVTKHQRSLVFRETIQMVSKMPSMMIPNACDRKSEKMRLFERLVNRLNRTLDAQGEHGLLFIDQGNEVEYTRLIRRMGVFNPIPSRFGTWIGTGEATKNIPVSRLIEDPVFKESSSSFFIQCADLVAFSLLRKEYPLESRNKYGVHECFDLLDGVLFKRAFDKDPSKQGIIRA
jgi:hypothetical protein